MIQIGRLTLDWWPHWNIERLHCRGYLHLMLGFLDIVWYTEPLPEKGEG